MTSDISDKAAEGADPRRLFVFNGGFLTDKRIRRILELKGWQVTLGKPGADDWVGVWGQSPTSPRGETVAGRTGSDILRVEDSFLRSVSTGREGEAPIGLNLDTRGVHFDPACPSDLETLLATHPLDDSALLNRGRAALERIQYAHLSKYNAFDPDAEVPEAPYVLVIDQTRDDASVTASGGNQAMFREMLVFAQTEHPGNRIVIKAHPETAAGHRPGHFGADDENDRVSILTDPVSPWALMAGATAVYTVSSQLGFEAIFAGHRPRVFGQPFYGGWGLTQDENPVPRRERKLSRAQLFAAAMILYPTWYDPTTDRLCELEDAISQLSAQARAWREDRQGYDAIGISRWKRPHFRKFFGTHAPIRFQNAADPKGSAKTMVWASHPAAPDLTDAVRVEDGFLRSRGLGAKLVPPLSLVADDLGIYYDPTHESRLDRLIAASASLPQAERDRAEALRKRITAGAFSKYNLDTAPLPDLPTGKRILVPGQVENDASIRLGCGELRHNLDLLRITRQENQDAVIVYKPHPDVEAGLRPGAISDADARQYADIVASNADPARLLAEVDAVWTLTSLLGFEALLRDKPVTCLGTPFYAGWGLTRDHGTKPIWRTARPDLTGLIHACLIGYPRYMDPVSGLPCPVERAVGFLESGAVMDPVGGRLGTLIQTLFAKFRR